MARRMDAPVLSIVMLAYDEEENVGPVVGELFAWLDVRGIDAELIVVDDGSRDGTGDAARRALEGRRGTVLRHETNRGMGAGLKTGFSAARAEWVTFLPADGQIPPDAVGTLWDARDGADVVLSVYDHRDDGALRTVLSFGVRALITAVHGVRLKSDGPYLIRRALFDPNQLAPDTFFLNFELPIRVLAAGLAVRTVTVACRPRRAGVSKSASFGRAFGVAKDLFAMRGRAVRELRRRW